MVSKLSKNESSEGSVDTDVSEDKNFCIEGPVTWWHIMPFFSFVKYMSLIYVGWYYLDQNVFPALWYVYVIIPLGDIIMPLDHRNVSKSSEKAFEKDWRFLLPLYGYWCLDMFTYFWGIYQISFTEFKSWFAMITFILEIGQITAVA